MNISGSDIFPEFGGNIIFDLQNCLAADFEIFGDSGKGQLIGKNVRVISDATGMNGIDDTEYFLKGLIGEVVAHKNQRVVIKLFLEVGAVDKYPLVYLGWIDQEEVEIVHNSFEYWYVT